MMRRSSGADCVFSRSLVHSHNTSAPFYKYPASISILKTSSTNFTLNYMMKT